MYKILRFSHFYEVSGRSCAAAKAARRMTGEDDAARGMTGRFSAWDDEVGGVGLRWVMAG
jgi:hypothetical protein